MTDRRPAPSPATSDRPRGALTALCVAVTTSWGLLYYSLPVALTPISSDTGWSHAAITGAFSAGLIVSAAAGLRVGKVLDTRGPRTVMTGGALLGVLALVLVAWAPTLPVFFLAWLLAGAAQATVLYPPAFAVITRWYGPRRVRPLTTLTLVAGLASTIFAPLTAWLIHHLGWRTSYLLLAGLLAAVTVPLHALFLNRTWSDIPAAASGTVSAQIRADIRALTRTPRFITLQATMALATLTLYTVTLSLIPLLLERGVAYATAALTLGLVGTGQVLGRLGYSALDRTTTPRVRTVAILGAGALGLGALALIPGPYWLLISLAVITGAARGCLTLLQATAVSDRWGTQNYGSVNAVFTAPMTAIGALAPVAGPVLAGLLGSYSAMTTLMALALAGVALASTRT
ncbi:MAG: transporter [Citricoccus sp.]|nr:transporter [Citricoccus sp. WCRC_4]